MRCPVSIFDQADIVIGIWICLLPVWAMTVGQAALAFVAFAAVHLVVSAVGAALGARETIL